LQPFIILKPQHID